MSAVVELDRVGYRYPGRGADALADVSISAAPGELILLAGPSGGGKTTLLRAIAGLVPHFHGGRFRGRVLVAGLDTRTAAAGAVGRQVGIAFQDPEAQGVFARVLRDVAFGLENHGAAPATIVPAARAALERVGAAHLAERSLDSLSGGELQRVALAGVLAPDPDVLLLDEPTSQLDDEGARALVADLRRLADAGICVICAEHRLDRFAAVADRTIGVDGARTCAPAEPPTPPPAAPRPGGALLLRAIGIEQDRGVGRVLRGADLDVHRGEVVALRGPNGAGKSTLLRVLAGLDSPRSGTVILDGEDVTPVLCEHRYPRIALVPQDPGRHPLCDSVSAELRSGLRELPEQARDHRCAEALELLALRSLAERHPRDLSAGERERLALGVAIAADPALLLLDEPTRGMDPARRAALAALLRERAASGRAVVVATHDAGFAAAAADRTIDLVAGCCSAAEPAVRA